MNYSEDILKCAFEANGCEYSSNKIEDLISHQNECEFNPINKSECEKACGALLMRNELKSHNCIQYLKSKHEDLEKVKNENKKEEKMAETEISTKSNEIKSLNQKLDSLITSNLEEKQLVGSFITKRVVKAPRVIRALLSVDRNLFYFTDPDSDKQIITQAFILELLESYLNEGADVLVINSGNGYSTITIAEMVGSDGKVTAIDRDKKLIKKSKEILETNFNHLNERVTFSIYDEIRYASLNLFDVIIVGREHLLGIGRPIKPETLSGQLKIGGRIIAENILATFDKVNGGLLIRKIHMEPKV